MDGCGKPLKRDSRDGTVPQAPRHFLGRFAALHPAPPRSFTPEAMEALMAHSWPGNVRELEHVVERAVVLCDGPLIREEDLPDTLRERVVGQPGPVASEGSADDLSVKKATRTLEETLIRRALERTGGNRTRAAELLEVSYRALLYKIKEYGLG